VVISEEYRPGRRPKSDIANDHMKVAILTFSTRVTAANNASFKNETDIRNVPANLAQYIDFRWRCDRLPSQNAPLLTEKVSCF